MKLNGHRNTIQNSLREEDYSLQFQKGPLKFITHLPVDAIVPELVIFINGQTCIKKCPIYLELEEPQNYIDFIIERCDNHLNAIFVSFNTNERMELKLSAGNKNKRSYRFFPSGSLQRLNGD